jgi:hypothetical protein
MIFICQPSRSVSAPYLSSACFHDCTFLKHPQDAAIKISDGVRLTVTNGLSPFVYAGAGHHHCLQLNIIPSLWVNIPAPAWCYFLSFVAMFFCAFSHFWCSLRAFINSGVLLIDV